MRTAFWRIALLVFNDSDQTGSGIRTWVKYGYVDP